LKLDDEGRRVDGDPLTYSAYINVPALLDSLRVPAEVPRGIRADDWPVWPEGWKPGDPWPRGDRWCHDEALFITVHQAFEVWFRQMLHELDDVAVRATAVAERHGRAIPAVHLADRRPDAARPLSDRLARFPSLAAFLEDSPWAPTVLESPAPAEHGPEGETPSLAWFADEWPVFSDRVDRARHMLEACIPFFEILLHMTPASFLDFRTRLVPASGFGSGQFREIEISLGLRERHLTKLDWEDPELEAVRDALSPAEREIAGLDGQSAERFSLHCPDDLPRIRRRLAAPTLRDLVYWLLGAEELCGVNGARRYEVADRIATANYALVQRSGNPMANRVGRTATADVWTGIADLLAHAEVVLAADLHRDPGPWLGFSDWLESLLRLDETLLTWREKHLRFVERVIGSRPGTGGGGLRYLRRTVDAEQAPYLQRGFPCLWQSRTLLL
jgi:tryptophan 2,3-dioxygenase